MIDKIRCKIRDWLFSWEDIETIDEEEEMVGKPLTPYKLVRQEHEKCYGGGLWHSYDEKCLHLWIEKFRDGDYFNVTSDRGTEWEIFIREKRWE